MKKIFSLLLTFALLTGCVFMVTGCGKEKKKQVKEDNTVEISYSYGRATYTVSVPKDKEGKAKYEFTTEKPEGITVSKSFYLVTDETILGFATSGLSYNTSAKYKEKYGDKKASFEGYLEFIEDEDLFDKSYLPGLKQFKINGRKALRYYNRVGSPSSYKYHGFFYMVGADDLLTGSKVDISANYKDKENLPTESKELDKETLSIIKSLKITEYKE